MPHRYIYRYPRPMLTVDAVVFAEVHGRDHILLIRRGNPPWKGAWALPGGFLEMDETLAEGAARELAEEAGLRDVPLRQLRVFDAVDRDPRGRLLTVAFVGRVDAADHRPRAGDDAADVAWFPVDDLPALAADHAEVIQCAILGGAGRHAR